MVNNIFTPTMHQSNHPSGYNCGCQRCMIIDLENILSQMYPEKKITGTKFQQYLNVFKKGYKAGESKEDREGN